jgi:hypothetical protein
MSMRMISAHAKIWRSSGRPRTLEQEKNIDISENIRPVLTPNWPQLFLPLPSLYNGKIVTLVNHSVTRRVHIAGRGYLSFEESIFFLETINAYYKTPVYTLYVDLPWGPKGPT